MLGSVIAETLLNAIKGKDIRVAQAINDLLTGQNLDRYFPLVTNVSKSEVLMAAICRWLMEGHSDPAKIETYVQEFCREYGLERPIRLSVKHIHACTNPVAVYATSVKEAIDIIEAALTYYPKPDTNIIRVLHHAARAMTVAQYLTQYNHIDIGDGHRWLSASDIINYAARLIPPEVPNKLGFFMDMSFTSEALRKRQDILPYRELAWATPLGEIDLNMPVSGAFLFPIHDASMWPNLHRPIFDVIATKSLPGEIAKTFLDFDSAVYLRHNFSMSNGTIEPPRKESE